MTDKHLKKMFNTLNFQGNRNWNWFKIPFHLHPMTIKKTNKNAVIMWRKRNICTLLVGRKIMQQLWIFLKNLKLELLYDPKLSLLAVSSKSTYTKDACIFMFITKLVTTASKEPYQMSINRWKDNEIIKLSKMCETQKDKSDDETRKGSVFFSLHSLFFGDLPPSSQIITWRLILSNECLDLAWLISR